MRLLHVLVCISRGHQLLRLLSYLEEPCGSRLRRVDSRLHPTVVQRGKLRLLLGCWLLQEIICLAFWPLLLEIVTRVSHLPLVLHWLLLVRLLRRSWGPEESLCILKGLGQGLILCRPHVHSWLDL